MIKSFNPLETVVTLVEFDEGPGLRIDIRIPWDRFKGLAQQIRWWSRMPTEDVRKSDVFSDKRPAAPSKNEISMWKQIQAELKEDLYYAD
jgi:hypothetical protein